jgi:hypothetical protein
MPRMRAPRDYGPGRSCDYPGCSTKLSRYTRERRCWQHQQFVKYDLRKERLYQRKEGTG